MERTPCCKIQKGARLLARVIERGLVDAKLHPQVRLVLDELVRERPDEDIRVLATRRSRERSEEGRESLTRAMREFL